MNDVHLTGQLICTNAAQVALVHAHLPLHVALTRAESGCLAFDVVQTTDPLVWQVDEHFIDEAAFRAHQARVASSKWGHATVEIERKYVVEGLSSSSIARVRTLRRQPTGWG